jgi:hypothetical protein
MGSILAKRAPSELECETENDLYLLGCRCRSNWHILRAGIMKKMKEAGAKKKKPTGLNRWAWGTNDCSLGILDGG